MSEQRYDLVRTPVYGTVEIRARGVAEHYVVDTIRFEDAAAWKEAALAYCADMGWLVVAANDGGITAREPRSEVERIVARYSSDRTVSMADYRRLIADAVAVDDAHEAAAERPEPSDDVAPHHPYGIGVHREATRASASAWELLTIPLDAKVLLDQAERELAFARSATDENDPASVAWRQYVQGLIVLSALYLQAVKS